jgi:hypothetical protein
MEQDRTWNLFALKLAGKASPQEWAELQSLIHERPEVAFHLQALTNFWHQHSDYDRERIEKAMKKIANDYAGKESAPPLPEKVRTLNAIIAEKEAKRIVPLQGFTNLVRRLLKALLRIAVPNMQHHVTNR